MILFVVIGGDWRGVVEGGSLIVVAMDWIGEKRVMSFSEFGLIWYSGTLGLDDFAVEKMVIWILISGLLSLFETRLDLISFDFLFLIFFI